MIPSTAFRGLTALAAAAAALCIAGAVAAHAHLLSSDPADGATVAAPKAIALTFSEKLEGKFSGAALAKADGAPLGSHSLLDPKDGKRVTVTPDAPLTTGAYTLSWHAVSVDGHRTKGDVTFTVR